MKSHIKNPLSLFLIILAIALSGIWMITELPIKMYPNMIKPGFMVSFGHSEIGSPEEMYKSYGHNIEKQLQGLVGIEELQATYYTQYARFKIECEWDVDEEDFKKKIDDLFMPNKTSTENKFWYNIFSKSERMSGNMMIAVSHETMDDVAYKEFLEANLLPKLKRIKDVSKVYFWGWSFKNRYLEIDRDKLLNFHLTVDDIKNRIKASMRAITIGDLQTKMTGGDKIKINVPPAAANIEELMNIVLVSDPVKNLTIRVRDIARFTSKYAGSDSYYALNGAPAQFVTVNLKADGDVKRACDTVEDELSLFTKDNPGTSFNIMVNPAYFIQNAINNLVINAIIGGIIASLVIFLLLGSFRNTIVIAISIPFCILTSFIFMKLFNVTINIISLGGLAIGVGMIVDSSIVSLENIFRRLSSGNDLSRDQKAGNIISAMKEVTLPVLVSILTSIVVFFPIIFTASYTKAILGDLAKAVVFTLAVSIAAALVIVPGVSGTYISLKKSSIHETLSFFSFFARIYERSLGWILFRKKRAAILIGIVFAILGASIPVTLNIKKEVIAKPTTKLLDIHFNFPDNNDIELSKKYAHEVEAYLKTKSDITAYSTYFWSPNGGFITAEMSDRHLYEDFKEEIEETFEPKPEAVINPANWDPGRMPLPRKNDLVIELKGAGNSVLTDFSNRVMSQSAQFDAWMHRNPWISTSDGIDVTFRKWVRNQELLNNYIQTATLNGMYLATVIEDGKTKYIRATFQDHQIAKYIHQLRDLPLLYEKKIIPLKAIAEVALKTESYTPLMYVDGVHKQLIQVSFKGKDKEKKENTKKLKAEIAKLEKPLELVVDYPDQNKEINQSYKSFKMALLASVALVFLIIAVLFNSIRYPLIILTTVPLSLIGVIWGLFITGSTISLNSMLGVILLCGLVVNNAILLIDFYRRQREAHTGIECIMEAAKLRMRPILMTTLTTLFAVLPIALAFGESGEILQPLGISIFFGLLVSTLLTLFVIPGFIRIVDYWRV